MASPAKLGVQWGDVRLLYVREMRSALRERHIVVNSLLVPVFLYPVILWFAYTMVSFVSGQTASLDARVMLQGTSPAHQALTGLLTAEKRIRLIEVADAARAIREGALDVLVELRPAATASEALPQNAEVRLTYDKAKPRSEAARQRVSEIVGRYRRSSLETLATRRGLTAPELQVFWVEEHNVASEREMGRFVLGLMLPMFLVVMLAMGALHPAIDATAGEREHSTWETLMTTGTRRVNIVVAKYLYVATLSTAAGLLNMTAMTISMRSVVAPLLRGRDAGMSFQIPLSSIPVILLGTVLLALLVSAGMMILGAFARTFKEGQAMAGPFFIALILPLNFLQAPGVELTPRLALIPVVNVALMFREAIAGTYRWPLIGITTLVELAAIAAALALAARILSHEDLVLGSYGGSFRQFVKQRLVGGPSRGGHHG
jgi:sodium transport system permease protein